MFIRTHNASWWEFTPPSLCFAEGDPPALGGGSVDPASTSAPAAPAPNLADYVAGLDRLSESLGSKLDSIRQDADRQPPEPPAAPVDLEGMSRAEFATHIFGTIGEVLREQIAEALSPVTSQLTSLQLHAGQRQALSEMDALKSSHKDFLDWKDDMIALAKTPGREALGVTDLFHLARGMNPEKLRTLDAKYNPPAPPPTPPRPRFGGLTGTPGGGSDGNGVKPLDRKSAGREAYAEVAARSDGVLRALENM